MTGVCEDRVVIVTGAGRGIGRSHALGFAAEGARVLVNDVDRAAADVVVAAVHERGGDAVANADDVGSFDGAARLVDAAIDRWGRLDTLVNNAGIVRDRMIVSMGAAEWDDVLRVHAAGTFATTRHAAAWWRDRAKAGEPVAGRIINTASGAGLAGSVGQANYSAAKAGIIAFTLVAASELARYGVTANVIAPSARTPMTETVFGDLVAPPASGFDALDPDNMAPLAVWLGSEASGEVTGRVFELAGGRVSVAQGWMPGPAVDAGRRWLPTELGPVVRELLAQAAPPQPVYGAS